MKKKKEYAKCILRNPALGCLDGEEGDHGHGAVVVVEGLQGHNVAINMSEYQLFGISAAVENLRVAWIRGEPV